MNSNHDVSLILSTALHDAEQHMRYSERSGYVKERIRGFVHILFGSDTEYDDEFINSFFESPSEEGILKLAASARKNTGGIFRNLLISETETEQIRYRHLAIFANYYPFGVPHVSYAYNAILYARRYALAFFNLVEQYSIYENENIYDDALAQALSFYYNRVDPPSDSSYANLFGTFPVINDDYRPAQIFHSWIAVMRRFVQDLPQSSLLSKRVNTLIDKSVKESDVVLNQRWTIDSRHASLRDKKVIKLLSALIQNCGITQTTVQKTLLKHFHYPFHLFVAKVSLWKEEDRKRPYVDAIVECGFLEAIRTIDTIAPTLRLSTVHHCFHQLAPNDMSVSAWQIRFIRMLVTIYERTNCVAEIGEDGTTVFVFGPFRALPHRYPANALVTKYRPYSKKVTPANDVIDLFINELAILTRSLTIEAKPSLFMATLVNILRLAEPPKDPTLFPHREYKYRTSTEMPIVAGAENSADVMIVEEPPIPLRPQPQPQPQPPIVVHIPQQQQQQPPPDIQATHDYLNGGGNSLSVRLDNGMVKKITRDSFNPLFNAVYRDHQNIDARDRWLTDAAIDVGLCLFAPDTENERTVNVFTIEASVLYQNNDKSGDNSAFKKLLMIEDMFIIIPVANGERENAASHWSTLVLYNRHAFHLDSTGIGGVNREKAENHIRNLNIGRLPDEMLEFSSIWVPRQENDWECGYFVITIAKVIHTAFNGKSDIRMEHIVNLFTKESTRAMFKTEHFKEDALSLMTFISTRGVKPNSVAVTRPQLAPRQQTDPRTVKPAFVPLLPLDPGTEPNVVIRPLLFDEFKKKMAIPFLDKDEFQGEYDEFVSFVNRLDDRALVRMKKWYDSSKNPALRHFFPRLYRSFFRDSDKSPLETIASIVDLHVFLMISRYSLSDEDFELSDEFFSLIKLMPLKPQGNVIYYLLDIVRPNVNNERETMEALTKLYGEWPVLFLLCTIDKKKRERLHMKENTLKLQSNERLNSFRAMKAGNGIFAPGRMRYVVGIHRKSKYIEQGNDEPLDWHRRKPTFFHTIVDEDEARSKQGAKVDLYGRQSTVCEFFDQYSEGYFVGHGTFGFALLYRIDRGARFESTLAVKFQANTELTKRGPTENRVTGAVQERDAMIRVQNAWQINKEALELEFYHHIAVRDYSRCYFDVEDRVFSKLLNKKDPKVTNYVEKRRLEKDDVLFQGRSVEMDMTVMDYVKNGSLQTFIDYNHSDFNEPFNMPLFVHCLIQVAGYLSALYTNLGFVHNDVTNNNILVHHIEKADNGLIMVDILQKKSPAKEQKTLVKNLVYNVNVGVDERISFVIPYLGILFKVADLGKARNNTPSKQENTPCFDMENLLLIYLQEVIHIHIARTGKAMPYLRKNSEFVSFILGLLRNKDQAERDYFNGRLMTEVPDSDSKEHIDRKNSTFFYHSIIEALEHIIAHPDADPSTETFVTDEMVERLKQVLPDEEKPKVRKDEASVLHYCISEVYMKNDLWRVVRPPMPSYHANCYARLFNTIKELMPGLVMPADYANTRLDMEIAEEDLVMNNYINDTTKKGL